MDLKTLERMVTETSSFTDDQVVDAFIEIGQDCLSNDEGRKVTELVKRAIELRSDNFAQKMIARYLKAPGGGCGTGCGCGTSPEEPSDHNCCGDGCPSCDK